MEELERDFIKANQCDPPPETAVTVEHVLPKNLSAPWAKWFTAAEHRRVVGLLGNLVPLSEKQNKSLRDQSWADKRKRFRGSNFKTTQQLAKIAHLKTGELMHRIDVTDEGFEAKQPLRHGVFSHGVGLTPDETEVWVVDGANERFHVYDNTALPPLYKQSVKLRKQPGWITFSSKSI